MAIINSVIVSGGGSAPAYYIEKAVDANGKLVNGNTIIDLTGVTDIGDFVLQYAYKTNVSISGTVDMSDIITISGAYACDSMFQGCIGLTSADLSALTTISGQNACNSMFQGCTGLTSVDLSSLTTIANGGLYAAFFNCNSLTKIYLPKITSSSYVSRPNNRDFMAFENSGLQIFDARNLQTVGNYGIFDNMFSKTQYLTTVNLNSLEHIGTESARAMFFCSNFTSTLTDLFFPMLTSFGTNPFYTNAFSGRRNLTIHFRKDAQATVEGLPNYATLWGAGSGSSVVFDLAGTLTGADSNAYTRSEIDSVYASETAGAAKTATAWKYNNVVYYTSGGSEPSIGDTIYSDDACTTSVTTITAIA